MNFLALFLSLPVKASTGRMRIWRGLKALGCATLRDGVYLLPDSAEHGQALASLGQEAQAVGGNGEVYVLSGGDEARDAALRALFDRSGEYAALLAEAETLRRELAGQDEGVSGRRMQALLRRFQQLARLDFFPGEGLRQAQAQLDELRDELLRRFSPDEPSARQDAVLRLALADYQGRTWATRKRPRVDRLASAWLIRRHIDPEARITWLEAPGDCRPDWLGFDFDGAAFSHVGARVTFETLLASFGLESAPGLLRLGQLVHCLDVGGLPVAEAPGVEAALSGLRAARENDDELLADASRLFDGLEKHYEETSHD